MRIAIPVADENKLAEQFSSAAQFAIFDVHDDTRAVGYIGRQAIADPGCGKSANFLKTHGVEVVLGHHVSDNAVNHLRDQQIVAIKDAPLLTADALIAHLVSGTLQATPPEVAPIEGGGCGSCTMCGTHNHDAPETPAASTCSDHDSITQNVGKCH